MASANELADVMTKLIGGNDKEATVRHFLDTGFPPFNHALSSRYDGGLPVGRLVEIAGPPSAGKTAISTAAMAAAQKMGGLAIFMDHERSFSMSLAPRLGLDVSPSRFVYKKPETFEESFGIVSQVCNAVRERKLIPDDAPICAVFDSLASMVPYSVLYDEKGKKRDGAKRNMTDKMALPQATSQHLPGLAQQFEDQNVCGIFLNQTRTKIGVMYGDPTTTPGGDSPKFYFSTRIMLGAQKIKSAAKGGPILGQLVTATMIKNKVARPFLKASWRFMYQDDGSGRFDVERSLVDFLEEQKVIEGAGPGFVNFEGKRIGKEALARQIEKEGRVEDLRKLLPTNYSAPVAAEVEEEDEKDE